MRLGLVSVSGSSMAPGLRDGDVVLVRWGARPRVGAVVVGSFAEAPEAYVIKRVARIEDGVAWLEGDNPAASVSGPAATVAGRVLMRWRQAREL